MTFYTDMRDNVGGALIAEYGRSATLRQVTRTYAPTTGIVTEGSPTDTAIKLISLPIERPKLRNIFRDETVERASWQFVVSAKETAAAGVVPAVNDRIIMDGSTYQVIDILKVTPGGTDVVYKILVEGANG